jgi:hypothetical protein
VSGFVEDWSDSFAEYEPRFSLDSHRHPKQRRINVDPAWIRTVLGTRRSGKTEEFVMEGLETADQFPGEIIPYVMPTIGRYKDIVYSKAQDLSNQFGLGLRINRSEFKVTTPNGGTLQIFGLATAPDAEKGRGKRFPLVIIDECGAHNQDVLKLAVTQTFGPATADFRGLGGRGLLLGGTPGYEPDCYWEQLIGGNSHVSKLGASVHFMTIWDNPFFKGREQMIIEAHLRENNLPANDAGFRREWQGEFCSNTEGLCYQRFSGRQLPRHMVPRGGYTVMGLDLGKHDPCAWVVVRFIIVEEVMEDGDGQTVVRSIHHGHVIASFEKSDCSIEEMAAITRKLQQAYHVSHIAGDSAGLGATIVQDLNTRYGLPIVPVKKSPVKVGAIWMADSMFGAGTLHVHEGCDSLVRQLRAVPWDDKRLRHHPRFPDHSLDALLYALTLSRQHEVDTALAPEPGSPEWYKEQERRDEQAALEYAARRRQGLAA